MAKHDTSVTESVWLCVALTYLGYELCSIVEVIDGIQYRVQCPACDFEDIKAQYEHHELALSDAKQFVDSFNKIVQIQKGYRRRGETQWTSPRWVSGEIG